MQMNNQYEYRLQETEVLSYAQLDACMEARGWEPVLPDSMPPEMHRDFVLKVNNGLDRKIGAYRRRLPEALPSERRSEV